MCMGKTPDLIITTQPTYQKYFPTENEIRSYNLSPRAVEQKHLSPKVLA